MRKLIKTIYIFIIFIFNKVFHLFLSVYNKRVVFFASFPDDVIPIIFELNKKTDYEIILFYHPRIKNEVSRLPINKMYPQSNKRVIRELFYLKTSKWIIVDTYYLILGKFTKKKGQTIIQTWHASGALKKFGLEDQSIQQFSNKEIDQFKQVYQSFDFVLTGSDIMGEIFMRSFGISENQLLKVGLPRMDKYANQTWVLETRKKIRLKHCVTEGNQVVLYAPTFRKNQPTIDSLPISFDNLSDPRIPWVALHPNVTIIENSPYIVYEDIGDLLIAADVVITDYSSLAFEASFLNKPVLFYTYDLEEYKRQTGLIENFETAVNHQIFQDNESLIKAINNMTYQSSEHLNMKWNCYNRGESTEIIVEKIIKDDF